MIIVPYKPISVNEAFNGERTRSKKYDHFIQAVSFLLKKQKLPAPPYKITLYWGVSNMGTDWDNPIKPFQDVLTKKLGINDNTIIRGEVEKFKVKKGQEFMMYKIETHTPTAIKLPVINDFNF